MARHVVAAAGEIPPGGRKLVTLNGRDDANLREGTGDAEAGQPCIVGRQQDITRMEGAVDDVQRGGLIEGAGQLDRHAQGVARRCVTVFADGMIE